MHDFFQNVLIFFNDAPLLVKKGLLEHCKVWVEHFGDINFQRKIDGVLSKHPSFAAELKFMNFKDNYITTEQDQEDLNEMIRTSDIYQEIMMLSVRIFFYQEQKIHNFFHEFKVVTCCLRFSSIEHN